MKALFINEADLCTKFVANLPEGWTAYAETAGFDLLLVRDDGAQLGIEAKMALNAKVILQALDKSGSYSNGVGPDFRAVLVPYGTAGADLSAIARRLGICVMTMHTESTYDSFNTWLRSYSRHPIEVNRLFDPALPGDKTLGAWDRSWVDHLPVERESLPDFVPDIVAGRPSPTTLSEWKIKAIKLTILLEERGYLTAFDFREFRMNVQRWREMDWLTARVVDGIPVRGEYVRGSRPYDVRRVHPKNYDEIAAAIETWRPKPKGDLL